MPLSLIQKLIAPSSLQYMSICTMARVHPYACDNSTSLSCSKVPRRLKNIGKWLIAFAGFPLAYVMLPISCCFRNPSALIVYHDEDVSSPFEKVQENIVVGSFGAASLALCAGGCLGKCGEFGPEDF